MDDLDKQIEDAKTRLEKISKLAELNTLNEQAASMAGTKKKANDPMERMLKWAFPGGAIFAGLGVVSIMVLNNFVMGLALGALGAMAIGFKIALTPELAIRFMQQRKPPEQPKQDSSGGWVRLSKGPEDK